MISTGFFKNNTYDKVRSDYAQEVADYIRRNFIQADNPLSVVEVGAGSGKFTNSVIASDILIKELYVVEPDREGIKKHSEKFNGKTGFPITYKNAPADKTELTDHIADIIFCGHCFHWFDFEETRKEFLRILKKSGQVFILGRFLDEDDPVSSEYVRMTRFGKRNDGFSNNIQAYSSERMKEFYGHEAKKIVVCEECIPYNFSQMIGKIRIRINSSGERKVKKIWLSVEPVNYFV